MAVLSVTVAILMDYALLFILNMPAPSVSADRSPFSLFGI
jgi:hypothetical protein